MNEKLWNRLQKRITRNHIIFKDKRIASLLAKSQSKTGNTNIESINNEIKIADLFFDNISEIPNDYDLAFMMVIRFLTLLKLSICTKADINFCISWFESKYGILRHIFTYDENRNNDMRDNVLKNIIYELSEKKNEERPLIKYSQEFNERIQNIKNKIMSLEFSNKDIKKKSKNLLSDICKLKEEFFLLFRYELFKSNYAINSTSSNTANSLVQMCQFFDVDIYIEELTVKNSKSNNSQFDFILKEVTAKIESISKLQVIQKPSNNNACNIIYDDDCKNTSNYYNVQLNDDSSEFINPMPFIPVSKLRMLYSPHDFILEGTLKILSAKYKLCKAEVILSCDNFEVDNAQMTNVQFNFKANSKVLKNKEKEDRWYNSIFLLFANEI